MMSSVLSYVMRVTVPGIPVPSFRGDKGANGDPGAACGAARDEQVAVAVRRERRWDRDKHTDPPDCGLLVSAQLDDIASCGKEK